MINTFLPSNTMARPSLILQNRCRNNAERKSPKHSFYELLNSLFSYPVNELLWH